MCFGDVINLIATANLPGGAFLWSTNETNDTISISPASGTNYTVTYTLNNCTSPAATAQVTVNPIPTVTNANALTICSGQMVNITGLTLTANVSGTNFTWVAADNPLVTGDNTTPQNSAAINDVLINSTSINQQVVYTVTPIGS
jgi:hypothetical protein